MHMGKVDSLLFCLCLGQQCKQIINYLIANVINAANERENYSLIKTDLGINILKTYLNSRK